MSGNHDKDDSRHKTEKSAFKIVDRRRFTAAGEVRTDAPVDTSPRIARPIVNQAPAPKPAPAAVAPQQASPHPGPPPQSASSIDFLSFIGSLATNAMAAMGLLPPAQSRGMPKNIGLAHEYIEIIVMLQERTVGNLSADESQALLGLIADLRLQFSDLQGSAPSTPAVSPYS